MTGAAAKVAAHDATISTASSAELEAALVAAREREAEQFWVDQVDRAERKLERAKADVVGAQEALANAKADLVAETERRKAEKAAKAAEAEGLPN